MQMQFHKKPLQCLRRIKGEVQTQEQTQELRLPDELPDIGSILGSWGQLLIRGKEWRSGEMELSCGVMVWTLYQPEDGSEPQTVESWIPFQFRWDLPSTDRDGRICVSGLLRSVDARVTAARKMMLRASVSVLGEAWITGDEEVVQPETVPEDICLLKRTYPVMLPREAGEKAFTMEEELTFPASAPKMEKLLRYSLHPELVEEKVISGKVVFRGMCLLHILYKSTDGGLCPWDFEIPFSQYSDLDSDYEPDARASICMGVTSLELEPDPEGRLRLRAGLTGQYVISDRTELDLVEDAYSTVRSVTVQREELTLPVALEEETQTLRGEQTAAMECSRVIDIAFYPDQPQMSRTPEGVEATLSGQFCILCYDRNGTLCSATQKWNDSRFLPADPNAQVQLTLTPSGVPQGAVGADVNLWSDMLLGIRSTASQGLPMVTGMETGEMMKPDPGRPSLIIRPVGKNTLWEIAKETGSTEEAIRKANRLTTDPKEDQLLLIPIL